MEDWRGDPVFGRFLRVSEEVSTELWRSSKILVEKSMDRISPDLDISSLDFCEEMGQIGFHYLALSIKLEKVLKDFIQKYVKKEKDEKKKD